MSRKQNLDPAMLESFAAQVDKFIIENNYTNKQFGDLIGVDEATIRKYRKAETLPSHEAAKKITLIMKMRYHELMGYKDPKLETTEDK